jgi:O-antigen/teichoic acid export membrane protein
MLYSRLKLNEYGLYILFGYLAIGINILTGFILFPMILKYLGLKALGMFGILFSIKSFVDLGVGGFTSSITKNLIKYKYLRNDITTFSFFYNNIYGLFALLFFIGYGYFIKDEYFISTLYFGIFVMISLAMNTFFEVMIANSKQHKMLFFRFIQQLLFFIFSISSFYLAENKTLDTIFLSLMISSIVVFLSVVYYSKNNFSFHFSIDKINKILIYRLLFTDGGNFFFNVLSTVLLLHIDILLIDYLYGAKSAGIYLIIFKIPNTIIMLGWRLSEPFRVIATERLKEGKVGELKKDFLFLEKKILFVSLFASIAYVLLGQYALEFWIGKENIPNIDYMYIVPAIVIVLSILQGLYSSVNYYTEGLVTVTILQIIETVFKVFFIIFLFDSFKELTSIVGWLFAFMFTILFYRKNSLKVIS